jgi:outer membrane lipoprotein-sorting protein
MLGSVIFVAAGSFLPAEVCAQQRSTSPQVILKKSAERYAALSSYQDVGVVIITTDEGTSGRIEKQPFKLFFNRPNQFRFEWLDYGSQKNGRLRVVWSEGNDTFTYWEPDKYEKEESLEMGIAGATGVSSGAAFHTPRLLMPEMGGWAMTDLKKTALVGEEMFEGELCYRIKGFDFSQNLNEVWIGKRDFLVRKLTRHSAFEDYTTVQEEIHRDIKTNQIAPQIFAFKPPIALNDPKAATDGEALDASEAATWSEFLSPEGGFEVLMPGPPVSQTLTLQMQMGTIVHRSHIAHKGGITCVIDYADIPKASAEPDGAKALFDQARDEFIKESQGKMLSERSVSLSGHPGREIKVGLYGGEAILRFYLAGERFYQLAITIPDRTEKSESEIEKFFSSFKIITKPKSVALASGCGNVDGFFGESGCKSHEAESGYC